MEGSACLRQARARAPDLKTIVFSRSDDRERIRAAFSAGALAYKTHPDDLAMAIRQLFIEPSIYFAEDRISNPQTQTPLSRRETEILELVAEGLSTADMARRLWVTRETVKFHHGNIYKKLGVSNRTAAARWAYDYGLRRASVSATAGTPPWRSRATTASPFEKRPQLERIADQIVVVAGAAARGLRSSQKGSDRTGLDDLAARFPAPTAQRKLF